MSNDRETQGTSLLRGKKVGDSSMELSNDCAVLNWHVRKEINWWDWQHEAARKRTSLFPNPGVAHQCKIISYNILRETKNLKTIEMMMLAKISINSWFWYCPYKERKSNTFMNSLLADIEVDNAFHFYN